MQQWIRQHNISQGQYAEERYKARLREMNELIVQLKDPWRPRSLLDFGGDKGGVASLLAEQYQLPSNSAIVSDIQMWYGHTREHPYSNITYQTLVSSILPFTDAQFDTIICSMVLHHITDISTTCKELRRILQKDGILFLREHDSESEETSRLIDIEHSLHELVSETVSKQEAIRYLANYKAFYLSINEWTAFLEKNGFEMIKLKYAPPRGATRFVYRVYRAV
jgi:ubiquinone/menaquinone biosynthesis C-methylase UbiE